MPDFFNGDLDRRQRTAIVRVHQTIYRLSELHKIVNNLYHRIQGCEDFLHNSPLGALRPVCSTLSERTYHSSNVAVMPG
jgi:hypothetical protein